MTQEINFLKSIDRNALGRRILIGGVFALTLMIIFLWGVNPRPEWGTFWKVRPFLVITFAGATGGLCSYFISRLLSQTVWQILVGNIISLIVFVIGLWLGTVLGLVGTLWH